MVFGMSAKLARNSEGLLASPWGLDDFDGGMRRKEALHRSMKGGPDKRGVGLPMWQRSCPNSRSLRLRAETAKTAIVARCDAQSHHEIKRQTSFISAIIKP
jgi:hypothetical protein